MKTGAKRIPLDFIKIQLASPNQIRGWAERRLPNGKTVGEVKRPDTLHYNTMKPIKEGLFCEQIFGPVKDFECSCGTKSRKGLFCNECGVEFGSSQLRRYRLGYIQLNSPVVHLWFLKGRASVLSELLDVPKRLLESTLYMRFSYWDTLTTKEIQRFKKEWLGTQKVFYWIFNHSQKYNGVKKLKIQLENDALLHGQLRLLYRITPTCFLYNGSLYQKSQTQSFSLSKQNRRLLPPLRQKLFSDQGDEKLTHAIDFFATQKKAPFSQSLLPRKKGFAQQRERFYEFSSRNLQFDTSSTFLPKATKKEVHTNCIPVNLLLLYLKRYWLIEPNGFFKNKKGLGSMATPATRGASNQVTLLLTQKVTGELTRILACDSNCSYLSITNIFLILRRMTAFMANVIKKERTRSDIYKVDRPQLEAKKVVKQRFVSQIFQPRSRIYLESQLFFKRETLSCSNVSTDTRVQVLGILRGVFGTVFSEHEKESSFYPSFPPRRPGVAIEPLSGVSVAPWRESFKPYSMVFSCKRCTRPTRATLRKETNRIFNSKPRSQPKRSLFYNLHLVDPQSKPRHFFAPYKKPDERFQGTYEKAFSNRYEPSDPKDQLLLSFNPQLSLRLQSQSKLQANQKVFNLTEKVAKVPVLFSNFGLILTTWDKKSRLCLWSGLYQQGIQSPSNPFIDGFKQLPSKLSACSYKGVWKREGRVTTRKVSSLRGVELWFSRKERDLTEFYTLSPFIWDLVEFPLQPFTATIKIEQLIHHKFASKTKFPTFPKDHVKKRFYSLQDQLFVLNRGKRVEQKVTTDLAKQPVFLMVGRTQPLNRGKGPLAIFTSLPTPKGDIHKVNKHPFLFLSTPSQQHLSIKRYRAYKFSKSLKNLHLKWSFLRLHPSYRRLTQYPLITFTASFFKTQQTSQIFDRQTFFQQIQGFQMTRFCKEWYSQRRSFCASKSGGDKPWLKSDQLEENSCRSDIHFVNPVFCKKKPIDHTLFNPSFFGLDPETVHSISPLGNKGYSQGIKEEGLSNTFSLFEITRGYNLVLRKNKQYNICLTDADQMLSISTHQALLSFQRLISSSNKWFEGVKFVNSKLIRGLDLNAFGELDTTTLPEKAHSRASFALYPGRVPMRGHLSTCNWSSYPVSSEKIFVLDKKNVKKRSPLVSSLNQTKVYSHQLAPLSYLLWPLKTGLKPTNSFSQTPSTNQGWNACNQRDWRGTQGWGGGYKRSICDLIENPELKAERIKKRAAKYGKPKWLFNLSLFLKAKAEDSYSCQFFFKPRGVIVSKACSSQAWFNTWNSFLFKSSGLQGAAKLKPRNADIHTVNKTAYSPHQTPLSFTKPLSTSNPVERRILDRQNLISDTLFTNRQNLQDFALLSDIGNKGVRFKSLSFAYFGIRNLFAHLFTLDYDTEFRTALDRISSLNHEIQSLQKEIHEQPLFEKELLTKVRKLLSQRSRRKRTAKILKAFKPSYPPDVNLSTQLKVRNALSGVCTYPPTSSKGLHQLTPLQNKAQTYSRSQYQQINSKPSTRFAPDSASPLVPGALTSLGLTSYTQSLPSASVTPDVHFVSKGYQEKLQLNNKPCTNSFLLSQEDREHQTLPSNERIKRGVSFSEKESLAINAEPEWMILSYLPVLPPALRPILRLNGDQLVSSDLNKLYQKILFRNERLLRVEESSELDELNLDYAQVLLQEAVDTLLENGKGGSPPVCTETGRPYKSLSDTLKGKKGRFRQNLLGKRVDYSGRSVIVVGPKLKIHECGLPKEMAVELYLPFLIRYLLWTKKVRTIVEAKILLEKQMVLQSSTIWKMLTNIMSNHPVLLNRAPTLHRLGIQAFQPRLVEGRAILLHPLVCPAFNADFDGDQMAVHVPLSSQARAEAWNLLWSRNNILSPATGQALLTPAQDMVLGCYFVSTREWTLQQGAGKWFSNLSEVLIAYNQKGIALHSPVWARSSRHIETGGQRESPLELRLTTKGRVIELRLLSQRHYNFLRSQMVQFVRTTPGRILLNESISRSIVLSTGSNKISETGVSSPKEDSTSLT